MSNVEIADQEYVNWPTVTEAHCEAVAAVVRSGKWHYGPQGGLLEQRLEAIFGRPSVATSSCAWAIFLALRALAATGKIVLAPAFGYHGTIHPIVWAGLKPVFVDCDPDTYNLCPEALEKALRDREVAAIIGVHIHGRPLSRAVVDIVRSSGIPFIEDACQAQGAKIGEELIGTLGDVAALSFNSRKTNPAGLGGACIFRDVAAAEMARADTNYGPKDVDGAPLGIGSYLPIGEFDAALAAHQLEFVEHWTEQANSRVATLRQSLGARLPKLAADELSVWHKVRIKGSEDERLALQQRGVRTSRWVSYPLPRYPAYQQYSQNARYPGAEEICANTFCLLDDDTPIAAQPWPLVERVARILGEVLND